MEEKIKKSILVIDYIVLIVAMIVSTLVTSEKNLQILFIYGVFLYSFTFRNYYIYSNKKRFKNINYIIETISIISIAVMDNSFSYIVIFAIIVEGMVLELEMKFSLIGLMIINILVFILTHVKVFGDYSKSLGVMIVVIPLYLLIYLIFYLVAYLIKQNRIIENSLKEITVKKLEKDNLYDNLKEAYEKIESITTLKERNRIAAEIHDTVGHTLTTVLIEIEASKRLMNKDNKDKSIEKLNLAQGQVRKGLNSIRSSVRLLADGSDILNFYKSINAVINQCEINSDVTIEREINENIFIHEEYRDIIMSALMEGLSNGLRHGNSNQFKFKLIEEMGKVLFKLKDNGKGTGVILPGFGLKSIRLRVEELEGELLVSSRAESGFTLSFKLPIKAKE
ncbi:sensor histidine kinase [Clostridium vincentii]|uniref:histidine kinase n=1 Tax=Clostridium vincentii TaxID=52704 RepID=A0A2T0BAT9_9CLOT|nr:histidine kinase [Clostridium vincentii]PRR80994.1 Sensor histidine kinase DesK [Clostridium vincentii]